jgi:hypothetical protein
MHIELALLTLAGGISWGEGVARNCTSLVRFVLSRCLLPVWVRAHYVLKEEFFASGMLAMTNHRQVQFLPEMKAG